MRKKREATPNPIIYHPDVRFGSQRNGSPTGVTVGERRRRAKNENKTILSDFRALRSSGRDQLDVTKNKRSRVEGERIRYISSTERRERMIQPTHAKKMVQQ